MLIRKVTPDSHCHVFPAMKYECSYLLPYCVNSDTPGTTGVPLAAVGERFSLPDVHQTDFPSLGPKPCLRFPSRTGIRSGNGQPEGLTFRIWTVARTVVPSVFRT